MASLLPTGKQVYLDSGGLPLVGGKVYTFQAGTSTPKPTYSDQAGAVPNTNPVILNSRGEALIFWSGSYKVELRDALDNLIWSVDNIVESNADITTGSTGSLRLPAGTTAQRDTVPSPGYIRYNIELSKLEYYSLASWVQVQQQLESGVNIKTVNGVSLVGSGNLLVDGSPGVIVVTDTSVSAATNVNYVLTNTSLVSRSNLSIWSQDFTQGRTPARAGVTPNSATAPDGTPTADKLVEDATVTNTHEIDQTTTSALGTFVWSFYAKAAERTRIVARATTSPANTGGSATIDLSTNSVVSSAAIGGAVITTNVTALTGGWARYELRIVGTPSTSILTEILLDNGTTTVYTGDSVSGVYLWGTQVESGTAATGYLATSGTTVTVNNGTEVLLPADPDVGSLIWVTVANGRTDNTIFRNGSTIMDLAEDLVINDIYATVSLRFMFNSWRIV